MRFACLFFAEDTLMVYYLDGGDALHYFTEGELTSFFGHMRVIDKTTRSKR